ncbi:MAG: hypothetical protein NTW95_05300 [Candidatus Aminicenantes bacterium]|nr:hypothetical protein [Candidatus Aminicenantes bacterium]
MKKTLAVLNDLKKQGFIADYAIGGGMGAVFYVEPFLTYDLDVFIVADDQSGLQPLEAIYRFLKKKGYRPQLEQIIIEGIPVQFLPAYNELLQEAVSEAREIVYQGTATRVMTAEHLAAVMVQTGRAKDRERFFKMMEETKIDQSKLTRMVERFGLRQKFLQWKRMHDEK